jgi:hypothetical protein
MTSINDQINIGKRYIWDLGEMIGNFIIIDLLIYSFIHLFIYSFIHLLIY